MKIGPDSTSRRDWIGLTIILYALGFALLAASIHEVSTNRSDQSVGNVSCYLLVDTTIRVVYHSFLTTYSPLLVSVMILTAKGNHGGVSKGPREWAN
jgi:hypothetical protein